MTAFSCIIRMMNRCLALFLVVLAGQTMPAKAEDPATAATIVIYNANFAGSRELAHFYAEKRSIPKAHVIGLECPVGEEISREQYDDTIAEPLREIFLERGWWLLRDEEEPDRGVLTTRIRFVALIRGMPMKIRGRPTTPTISRGRGRSATAPRPRSIRS